MTVPLTTVKQRRPAMAQRCLTEPRQVPSRQGSSVPYASPYLASCQNLFTEKGLDTPVGVAGETTPRSAQPKAQGCESGGINGCSQRWQVQFVQFSAITVTSKRAPP